MKPFSIAKNILSNALNLRPHPNFPMHSNPKSEAFTFGDAVPVLDGHDLSNYTECWFNGRWYEPQVSLEGLSRSYKATPYLSSGIIFKRNFLANLFIEHQHLKRKSFEQMALDFIWCGNTYAENFYNLLEKRKA